MSWSSIIGQERVKALLRQAFISQKISHAYLFYGHEGVGKDAAAIEFAKLMNCLQPVDASACDKCSSCRRMGSLQHPNVRFVVALPVGKNEKEGEDPFKGLDEKTLKEYREAIDRKAADPYIRVNLTKANAIKINSVRDIKKFISLTRLEEGMKVVIISEAEKLNINAANALLKTLEEPSANSVFILTTSIRDVLPSTIVSRCQLVRFELLREKDIRKGLNQFYPELEKSQVDLISKMANGSFLRAKELIVEDLVSQREEIIDFLRTVVARPTSVWVDAVEELIRNNDKVMIIRSMQLLTLWLRDALLLSQNNGESVVNIDDLEPLKKFVKHFKNADLTGAIKSVDHAIALVQKNIYLALILVNLAINLKKQIAG